jgi:NADH-quinone oxidoreductase subunit L
MEGEQDIRKMGGLKKTMPVTYSTFLIGTVAIAGIPPFAGFFSKDEILSKVFGFSYLIWVVALIGSLMTAFYMFRLLYVSFFREFRGTAVQIKHIHEPSRVMLLPLIILAGLSAFGGIIDIPDFMKGNAVLSDFLAPVFADSMKLMEPCKHPASHGMEWGLMAIAVFFILLTVWLAYRSFAAKGKGPFEKEHAFIPRLLTNKYYIDEIYDFLFVRPVLWLSEKLHKVIELKFIDRIVNGIGNITIRAGNTIRYAQNGHVGFYLFIMVIGIIAILLLNFIL